MDNNELVVFYEEILNTLTVQTDMLEVEGNESLLDDIIDTMDPHILDIICSKRKHQ